MKDDVFLFLTYFLPKCLLRCLFGFVFFIIFSINISAQNIYNITKPVEIPFEIRNDFMIVKVIFDKKLLLNFIFDTGAEHTVLLNKEIANLLKIPFERRIQILGADMQKDLFAYLVRRIHLQISTISLPNQSLLVLEEDYLELGMRTGVEIQGVIGADVFKAYRVSIDYEKKILKLSPSSSKSPGKSYQKIPIDINKNKPYLNTDIELSDTTKVEVKLLLDTGANLALLLHTDTHSDLKLPESVIPGEVGVGLGGKLNGFSGRVRALLFRGSDLKLNDVVSNFQELYSDMDTAQIYDRNGIVGNQILRRFHVVIDYPQQVLYLKPNRKYKQKFEFDKSGLILIAGGKALNKYYVSKVIPGSPAAEVGIIRGDLILRLNGTATTFFPLDTILKKLKRKPGKKIRLVILRQGRKMKRTFVLRDLI